MDLGTGNGHFLLRLREGKDDDENEEREAKRWKGRMMGVDYSAKSVEFARSIAEKGFGTGVVEFQCWDIITQSAQQVVLNGECEAGWDVVLDKGTFDAISLSEEKDECGRRICEVYKERVLPLIKEGGVFIITSCNWTLEELNGWFESGGLKYVDTIRYKSFSFGGKKGQTISSVCYRKSTSR